MKDFENKKEEYYKEMLKREELILKKLRKDKNQNRGMGKYSESDIEKAMKQAGASLAIEGLYVSHKGDELIRQKLRGDITKEEFLKRALEIAKSEG